MSTALTEAQQEARAELFAAIRNGSLAEVQQIARDIFVSWDAQRLRIEAMDKRREVLLGEIESWKATVELLEDTEAVLDLIAAQKETDTEVDRYREAGQLLYEEAARYLDTGRGDLDGALDGWRLAVGGDPE